MLTVVLTYRNRTIDIVKRCLESLAVQESKNFELIFVNYGSVQPYTTDLEKLLVNYSFIKLIYCETKGQLWNKSHAINIALKSTNSESFFVGDVDMIYAPNFISVLHDLVAPNYATFFQVGFLSQEESNKEKKFEDYTISFKSGTEATGMTLFNTKELLAVNGYDEFYHGWGAEDTDVHIRLKNNNVKVNYYNQDVLLLHQWHPKHYRTKESLEPFHSYLEQINHAYLTFTQRTDQTKANTKFGFGNYHPDDYSALAIPDESYALTNQRHKVKAFVHNVMLEEHGKVLKLIVNEDVAYKSLKTKLKQRLGKKTIAYLPMQSVNDLILELIIQNFRNCAYTYEYNQQTETISLSIKLI